MQEGATNSTRTLLACGIGAGAIYVALGVLQILIRPGFDVTRHPLSILADRKSTRLNSSHIQKSRMPSSA